MLKISLKLNYFLDEDAFEVNKFGRLKFAFLDTAQTAKTDYQYQYKNYISIKYLHRIYAIDNAFTQISVKVINFTIFVIFISIDRKNNNQLSFLALYIVVYLSA